MAGTHNLLNKLASKVTDALTAQNILWIPGYGYLLGWGDGTPVAQEVGGFFWDRTNKIWYKNTGTYASPTFVEVGGTTDLPDPIAVNTINERTSASGVTVDGVLLKDNAVNTDTINEKTSATGVTIDGVLLKDSQVTTDVINEKTGAAGVTVDGVLLKDGEVTTNGGAILTDAFVGHLVGYAATGNVVDLTVGNTSGGVVTLTSSDVANLPAATVGMFYLFSASAVSGTAPQINPDDADTIFINGAEQAAGLYISPGAIGDWCLLYCFTAGKWRAFVDGGATWTVETP